MVNSRHCTADRKPFRKIKKRKEGKLTPPQVSLIYSRLLIVHNTSCSKYFSHCKWLLSSRRVTGWLAWRPIHAFFLLKVCSVFFYPGSVYIIRDKAEVVDNMVVSLCYYNCNSMLWCVKWVCFFLSLHLSHWLAAFCSPAWGGWLLEPVKSRLCVDATVTLSLPIQLLFSIPVCQTLPAFTGLPWRWACSYWHLLSNATPVCMATSQEWQERTNIHINIP